MTNREFVTSHIEDDGSVSLILMDKNQEENHDVAECSFIMTDTEGNECCVWFADENEAANDDRAPASDPFLNDPFIDINKTGIP